MCDLLSGYLTGPSVGIFPLCRVNMSARGEIREVRHWLHNPSVSMSLLSQAVRCLSQSFGTWQKITIPSPKHHVKGLCAFKARRCWFFLPSGGFNSDKTGSQGSKEVMVSRTGSAGRPELCAEGGECRSCGEMEIMAEKVAQKWKIPLRMFGYWHSIEDTALVGSSGSWALKIVNSQLCVVGISNQKTGFVFVRRLKLTFSSSYFCSSLCLLLSLHIVSLPLWAHRIHSHWNVSKIMFPLVCVDVNLYSFTVIWEKYSCNFTRSLGFLMGLGFL